METKVKILAKARELFFKLGIKGVTMDMIASESGVSKRTIYEHFKDKNELLLESLECEINKKNEQYLEIISTADNVIEAMFLIIENQNRMMSQLTPVFIEDLKKNISLLKEHFHSGQEKQRDYVTYLILQKGKNEGIFRDYLNIEVVDNFIHDMANFLHSDMRIRLRDAKKEDIVNCIFLPYLRGLCTQKGIDLMDKYFSGNYITMI